MKRIGLTLITMLLLSSLTAMAKPVDTTAARTVAQNLLHKAVVNATPDFFAECFLFVGTDGQGFALVAADDCVRPLLGYSLSGRFSTTNLPLHVRSWIDGYQKNIASLRQAGTVGSPEVQGEWLAAIAGYKFNVSRDTAVAPLMTTLWDQLPYYNAQCPYSTVDSTYALTGCVATATAQVMKYWNHPAVGRGSHSYTHPSFGTLSAQFDTTHYDWAHMPNRLNRFSSQQEVDAVAQLMYHVGVAVEMGYGVSGSGAHVSGYENPDFASSENALKNFFRYNQALFTAHRNNYTNVEWDKLLTAELNASRPIVYSGSDGQNGHAFVLDGYDSLGLYHVNWGWSGYCDGYYTFDNLSPDGSGSGGNASDSYSIDNEALLHVFPATEDSLVSVAVVSNDTTLGTVVGGGTFAAYTPTTLHATASEGNRFLSWKSGNRTNPFVFSPNNDYSDTAIFVPIFGDTLGYCSSNRKDLWGEYADNTPEWGIRIPASSIPAHRQLSAIQFYGVGRADYSIKVYLGNNFETLIFSTNYNTPYSQWYTVPLTTTTPLIDSLPIWIVLSSRSWLNPAVYSAYSGNPDGSWYKRGGTTWEHLENRNEYATWMIRAILSPLEPVVVTAVSSHADRGTVTGGGTCYPGDTIVLTATPAEGYRFATWSTGERENPLHLRVTTSESIVATFVPNAVAIDQADADGLSYSLQGLTLTVNPLGHLPVDLFDLQGRRLATFATPASRFALPAAGVYMLRCGGAVRKIVAVE